MGDSGNRDRTFLLGEALKAQQALRQAAGLGPEHFPVEAFVGMISDEVQALREKGWNDNQIAEHVRKSSTIDITGEEISENYAEPDERHHG